VNQLRSASYRACKSGIQPTHHTVTDAHLLGFLGGINTMHVHTLIADVVTCCCSVRSCA
jgi:hypothetical protein